MTHTRRQFLSTAAATAASITVLPYAAQAGGHAANEFAKGSIKVHPVSHASFVMETPVGTIYCDPVGEASGYFKLPKADLILVTHQHGDHYKPETLSSLLGRETKIITNPAVQGMLPDGLKTRSTEIANGASTTFGKLSVEAIPAYNLTQERLKFHPKGRDNGYLLNFEGFRIYISGDTEDVPEMRALKDVDLAFVCMNLPFTMDAKAAASAVAEFKPKFVYPYHFRGRGEGGTQDPAEFAKLVGDASDVKSGTWYG